VAHGGQYQFFHRIGRLDCEAHARSRSSGHAARDFSGAGKAHKAVLIGMSGGEDLTRS